jgi:RNA-binding protein NOB1
MNKKFCPSCGNPSLLRTSVSITQTSDGSQPKLKIHLKKNFQYRTRGTIYSIPKPRPGSSKTGTGEGLILREDQSEWQRAETREKSRRDKEERQISEAIQTTRSGDTAKLGSWMDPDWVPSMMDGGNKSKRRDARGLPSIGHGRKNPNERRRKK